VIKTITVINTISKNKGYDKVNVEKDMIAMKITKLSDVIKTDSVGNNSGCDKNIIMFEVSMVIKMMIVIKLEIVAR
jgi:hypothetical protein